MSKWKLLINGPNYSKGFASEKKLRAWAKANSYGIKRSPIDERNFYTESCQYVPGNK